MAYQPAGIFHFNKLPFKTNFNFFFFYKDPYMGNQRGGFVDSPGGVDSPSKRVSISKFSWLFTLV